jgi:hypothetical protein
MNTMYIYKGMHRPGFHMSSRHPEVHHQLFFCGRKRGVSIGSIREFNSLASPRPIFLIAGSADPGCGSQSTIDIAGKEKVVIFATAGNGGGIARGGRHSIVRPHRACSMGGKLVVVGDFLLWWPYLVASCHCSVAERSISGCCSWRCFSDSWRRCHLKCLRVNKSPYRCKTRELPLTYGVGFRT